MCHPGEVMSRSRLLERVLRCDTPTESSIVDVYIHDLRSNLEKDVDDKVIRSDRGVGCAIRAD
jgi:DNA-binding response OmpR family regulator